MDEIKLLPALATGRLFSFGGGVQSHAVLALQALGKINPYDAFVFSNVGIDSENPETLDYLDMYTIPFCMKYGIDFVEVCKTVYGKPETLKEYIYRTERSVPIPARMSNGAPGNRSCTNDFKVGVVDKWIKGAGYTNMVVGLGISIDEFHRVRHERWHNSYGQKQLGFNKRREYPLINLRINRKMCREIILSVGLPLPPKSSCYFCPFKRRNEWIEFKIKHPDLFQEAVKIDNIINEKRAAIGKDRVYIHPDCIPLAQAVGNQMTMFDFDDLDQCDSGYCMT